MPMWGGAFDEPTDADLRALNDSLPFDRRMAAQDVQGSIAYAHALAAAGVLTAQERDTIVGGLARIGQALADGTFTFDVDDEDIHTAIERALIVEVGPAGGKLHTGRSRNDQVATDLRLWTMAALAAMREHVRGLLRVVAAQAETHAATLMPGYTHVQSAQPITVGHWLMSYAAMLQRDDERLAQAGQRASVSPLGSGALAGTPYPIDRAALAAALGFAEVSRNSLDAVSDRDFVVDALYALAMLGVHLSRLGEDVVLFSSPAFGFVRLHERYSTGSSLMPQKRNADPMELARGKAGRLIGHLAGLLATLKGLPSGYNKDLQEDKEALFDAVDTLHALLPVVTGVIATLTFDVARMRAALDDTMLATDLADYLVARGVPFREAHHIAGRVVRLAEAGGLALGALSLEDLRGVDGRFDANVTAVFDFDAAVARRAATGGTAPEAVQAQVRALQAWLVGV